jgi:hypothetical protein
MELTTIVNLTVGVGAAIDSAAFPNTPQWYFWTSSPYAAYSGYARFVAFKDGSSSSDVVSSSYNVRCVR